MIEQEPHLGGSLKYHGFGYSLSAGATALNEENSAASTKSEIAEPFSTAAAQRNSLVNAIESHPHIRVLRSATCNAWFTDHYLPVLQGTRLIKLRAKQTILATGSANSTSSFATMIFQAWLCAAHSIALRASTVIPQPVVVLAGNDHAYRTALSSHDGGANVTAIIDLRDRCDDPALSEKRTQEASPYRRLHGL